MSAADYFTDEDGDDLSYGLTKDLQDLHIFNWIRLDADTGVFSGVASNNDVGNTVSLVVTGYDGWLGDSSNEFSLTVIA